MKREIVEQVVARAGREMADLIETEDIFWSVSSANRDTLVKSKKYQTVFVPALILLNLSEIDEPRLNNLKQKLQLILLKQKSRAWSFNYWVKKTPEEKKFRLPDDLDDTFVCLAAMQKSGYEFSAKDYAKITRLLVYCEDRAGGPYRTWIVGEKINDKRWLEVDLTVNVNVAYFLFLNEISLPRLDKYIERKIVSGKLDSRYYPDVFSVIYFLARFYRGRSCQTLIDLLLKRFKERDGWGNCLDTALAVSALIDCQYFGREVEAGVKHLLDQFDSGGWQWAGFCLDPMIGKEKYYNGSKALTFSFCLQAIDRYRRIANGKKVPEKTKTNPEMAGFYQKVINLAEKRMGNLDRDLKNDAKSFLAKYQTKDEDREIVLLPFILASKFKKNIKESAVINLSLANLSGWMAYTIYDDFLDDEGEKKYLPMANLWFRELIMIYQNLNIDGLDEYFSKLMDEMEEANYWEVKHCRFEAGKKYNLRDIPDFGGLENLAGKSIGHSLSGVAILLSQKVEKKVIEKYLAVFRNYLIARQLNDDAHDWEEDLRRGQINAVGAMVLRDWQKICKKKEVDLKKDLEKLQVIFWEKTIKKVSRIIVSKVDFAKKLIIDLRPDFDLSFLNKKLDNLRGAAKRAMVESREAREFMEGF